MYLDRTDAFGPSRIPAPSGSYDATILEISITMRRVNRRPAIKVFALRALLPGAGGQGEKTNPNTITPRSVGSQPFDPDTVLQDEPTQIVIFHDISEPFRHIVTSHMKATGNRIRRIETNLFEELFHDGVQSAGTDV